MFLGVSKVLVHSDEEFVGEIRLGRFDRFWSYYGRKASNRFVDLKTIESLVTQI